MKSVIIWLAFWLAILITSPWWTRGFVEKVNPSLLPSIPASPERRPVQSERSVLENSGDRNAV